MAQYFQTMAVSLLFLQNSHETCDWQELKETLLLSTINNMQNLQYKTDRSHSLLNLEALSI